MVQANKQTDGRVLTFGFLVILDRSAILVLHPQFCCISEDNDLNLMDRVNLTLELKFISIFLVILCLLIQNLFNRGALYSFKDPLFVESMLTFETSAHFIFFLFSVFTALLLSVIGNVVILFLRDRKSITPNGCVA